MSWNYTSIQNDDDRKRECYQSLVTHQECVCKKNEWSKH